MSLRTAVPPLLIVLAVAGCSSAIPDAEPGHSVPLSSPAQSSTASAGLAAIQACDLLSSQEVSSLGMPLQGRPNKIVGLRTCDWGDHEGGVSTSIDEESGIDELDFAEATNVTDVTIGGHQSVRAVENSGPGYCSIYIAVGDSASVGVSAIYPNDTPRACAAADKAAALVEPKLP